MNRRTMLAAAATGLASLALLAPGAASAQAAQTFTGSCSIAGLNTVPVSGLGTCTGQLNGGASATYSAQMHFTQSGTSLPLGGAKNPDIPSVLPVLLQGTASLALGPALGQPPVASFSMNVTETALQYVFSGSAGGLGFGSDQIDATGDSEISLQFAALAS